MYEKITEFCILLAGIFGISKWTNHYIKKEVKLLTDRVAILENDEKTIPKMTIVKCEEKQRNCVLNDQLGSITENNKDQIARLEKQSEKIEKILDQLTNRIEEKIEKISKKTDDSIIRLDEKMDHKIDVIFEKIESVADKFVNHAIEKEWQGNERRKSG